MKILLIAFLIISAAKDKYNLVRSEKVIFDCKLYYTIIDNKVEIRSDCKKTKGIFISAYFLATSTDCDMESYSGEEWKSNKREFGDYTIICRNKIQEKK